MTFKVPPDNAPYYLAIKERSINLIKSSIWSGISIERLELWLKNFQTDEEKYFASCVLDALIYRSNDQTKSMIFELISRKLPDIFRLNGINIGQKDLLSLKKFNPNLPIRFSTVLPPATNSSESGHQVVRSLRQEYCNEQYLINPGDINTLTSQNKVNVIVFIDDILGTGSQFDECYIQNNLRANRAKLIYAPLVAHQKGIDFINKKYPEVLICYVDHFALDYSFFNEYFSNDGANTPDIAKSFYLNLLTKIGAKKLKPENLYGRGNLEMVYAFEHGAPNTSLQVLYYDQTWNPIVKR